MAKYRVKLTGMVRLEKTVTIEADSPRKASIEATKQWEKHLSMDRWGPVGRVRISSQTVLGELD